MKEIRIVIVLFLQLAVISCAPDKGKQWSIKKINNWYQEQPWLVGANYVPSNAINPLEMWQPATFSPELIDKELGYAESLGFTTMRIFLAYLPWQEDAEGYYQRVDQFLEICSMHDIRPRFVFFDDCWHPVPRSGKQPEPLKGIHNSGWVQCPGAEILGNPGRHDELKPYVQGFLKRFGKDKRVLTWDLYNEPGNPNYNYQEMEVNEKATFSLLLLKKAFEWAREIDPDQPISVDVWSLGEGGLDQMSEIDRYAWENSDYINFHIYMDSTSTAKAIQTLQASGRPLICTEYMARTTGSTFFSILPLFKEHKIGAINWGFVDGKSQTLYPWDSWEKAYENEPELWFHDILRQDGTPYSQEEINIIKKLTRDN